jgi:hypothetical protein
MLQDDVQASLHVETYLAPLAIVVFSSQALVCAMLLQGFSSLVFVLKS